MAVPRSLKNATVTIYDDTTTTRNSIELDAEDGDLRLNFPNPAQHVLDRGAPGNVIDGEHVDPTGSMTIQFTTATGGEDPIEVFGGTATSWAYHINDLTTSPFGSKTTGLQALASAVKVWQAKIALASPSGGSTENLYLVNCHTDSLEFTEGMPNKLVVNFTMYGYRLSDFMGNID